MSRTKPNHRRVWGPKPLRTVGDRRKARPHGADARDYAAVFRVLEVPSGRNLRPCRGPSQITDGFGARSHSARLEIGAKHVRTAPTRGTMQPFSGFSKCRFINLLLCLRRLLEDLAANG